MVSLVILALAILVVLVVLGLIFAQGRKPEFYGQRWIADPLSVRDLKGDCARVYLSVPCFGSNGHSETFPVLVNPETRREYLRYGPAAFAEKLLSLDGISGYCLIGENRETADRKSLGDFYRDLFGEESPEEMLGLIHTLTETDFMALEDGEAIVDHVERCGFEPVSSG